MIQFWYILKTGSTRLIGKLNGGLKQAVKDDLRSLVGNSWLVVLFIETGLLEKPKVWEVKCEVYFKAVILSRF